MHRILLQLSTKDWETNITNYKSQYIYSIQKDKIADKD